MRQKILIETNLTEMQMKKIIAEYLTKNIYQKINAKEGTIFKKEDTFKNMIFTKFNIRDNIFESEIWAKLYHSDVIPDDSETASLLQSKLAKEIKNINELMQEFSCKVPTLSEEPIMESPILNETELVNILSDETKSKEMFNQQVDSINTEEKDKDRLNRYNNMDANKYMIYGMVTVVIGLNAKFGTLFNLALLVGTVILLSIALKKKCMWKVFVVILLVISTVLSLLSGVMLFSEVVDIEDSQSENVIDTEINENDDIINNEGNVIQSSKIEHDISNINVDDTLEVVNVKIGL